MYPPQETMKNEVHKRIKADLAVSGALVESKVH